MQMHDLDEALNLHKIDLEMCEKIGIPALQARAYGNLGAVYEALHSYNDSLRYFEKQLSLSTDGLSKVQACEALGKWIA